MSLTIWWNSSPPSITDDVRATGLAAYETEALTLEDQEIVLLALEEADELDDSRVIDTSHNLDLFEDVGALARSEFCHCLLEYGE